MKSLDELKSLIADKDFTIDGTGFKYIFTKTQLTIKSNKISMHHYDIYEESSKYYLRTNPTLYTEDLHLEISDDKIILTEKFSKRHKGALKRE